MALAYPLINGLRYDFTSLEINLDGVAHESLNGLKSVKFSDELEPGEVRGRWAHLVGMTRGTYKAEGGLTLFFQDGLSFVEKLGESDSVGWMEKPFNLTLNYSESGQPLNTVVLEGCRAKKADDSQESGGDPLETSFDLLITLIKRNGKYAISKVRK